MNRTANPPGNTANIYASQFQLYLPSKEELKKKLIEWSEAGPDTKVEKIS